MKEYVLSIDCCSAWTTLGLSENGTVKGELNIDAGKRQSLILPTLLQHFLEVFSLTPENIDLFAVVAGPGSFTGIKVGISFTTFLAWAGRKPIIPLSALECMAFEKIGGKRAIAASVLWAGGGRVYAGLFRSGEAGTLLESILPNRAYTPEELQEAFEQTGLRYDDVFWLTDRPEKIVSCFPLISERFEKCIPRGTSCVCLANGLKETACPPFKIRAQYLRDPDLG